MLESRPKLSLHLNPLQHYYSHPLTIPMTSSHNVFTQT